MKRILTLSFFALMITVFGCRVIKPGTDTVQTEETKTEYKQQNFDVPGATVNSGVGLEMLIDAMTSIQRDAANGKTPVPTPKQTVVDPQGKAQLTYWVDQYGKLQMSCESKDQTVSVLVAEVTRLNKEVTKKTEVVYKTPVWCYIVISILGTLLFFTALILVILLKKK